MNESLDKELKALNNTVITIKATLQRNEAMSSLGALSRDIGADPELSSRLNDFTLIKSDNIGQGDKSNIVNQAISLCLNISRIQDQNDNDIVSAAELQRLTVSVRRLFNTLNNVDGDAKNLCQVMSNRLNEKVEKIDLYCNGALEKEMAPTQNRPRN